MSETQETARGVGRGASLAGKRVLVTRSPEQATTLVERLRALGAEPVLCPTIRAVPLQDYEAVDAAIRQLAEYNWVIFTSANGVRFFWERLRTLGYTDQYVRLTTNRLHIGAIGPATAAALAERGCAVGFVPPVHTAEALVATIGDVHGQHVLLPQADIARPVLADGLGAKGALVDSLVVYRTVAPEQGEIQWLLEGEADVDITTFTSPSTVHNLVALLGERSARDVLANARIACIGPTTAAAAEAAGLHVDMLAAEHSVKGLIQAIVSYTEEHQVWT